MEVDHKLAIIVKGNSKYIRSHRMKRLAQVFYDEIRTILQAKGYTVEFDEGKAYTLPKVWAGVCGSRIHGALIDCASHRRQSRPWRCKRVTQRGSLKPMTIVASRLYITSCQKRIGKHWQHYRTYRRGDSKTLTRS